MDAGSQRHAGRPVRSLPAAAERCHRARAAAGLCSPGAATIMSDLLVSDFDYELPEELIAQEPPAERGQSRMLVMNRDTGEVSDSRFSELPSQLREGDLLVLNDSRVIPARLYARRTLRREKEKPTGRIEVMLTEPAGDYRWHALVRPGRKVAIGEILVFPSPSGAIELKAEV